MNTENPTYKVKTASKKEICAHFYSCDSNFSLQLSQRVNIDEYAKKIFDKAITFEAWSGAVLIGLVAAYFNDPSGRSLGYITNVSVSKSFTGHGIATILMNNCFSYAKVNGIKNITLEVSLNNNAAIQFYKKFGFQESGINGDYVSMCLNHPYQ